MNPQVLHALIDLGLDLRISLTSFGFEAYMRVSDRSLALRETVAVPMEREFPQ